MLAPNTLLQGRYLTLQPIGKGGMGEVYLAIDQRLGSAVALKRTFFTENQTLKQAFEREARILARLRHTALPKVTDTFTEETHQYLVMEYISGDDLGKKLFEYDRPFPVPQVLNWAESLLDALEYLHTHEPPIIHRDIKPQNLKLTEGGQIILLDFGLAKNTVSQTGQTSNPASVVGYTLAYAPLEQIRGTGTVPKSDIYALSATIYHFLTNINPPDSLLRAAALVDGLPDPLIPLHEINSDILPEVSQIIMQGMALSLDKRLASAREMRRLLQDAMRERRESMGAQTFVLSEVPAEVQKVISNQFVTQNQPENYTPTPTNPTPNYVSNPTPPNYVSNPIPQNFVSNPNPSQQKTEVLQDLTPTLQDVSSAVPNVNQFAKTEQLPLNSNNATEILPSFDQPNQLNNPQLTAQIPVYNQPQHNTNPNARRTEQFVETPNPNTDYDAEKTADVRVTENAKYAQPRNLLQVEVPQNNSVSVIPEQISYTKPNQGGGSGIVKGILAVLVGGFLALVVAAGAGLYFLNPFGASNTNVKQPNANVEVKNSPTPTTSPTAGNTGNTNISSNNTVAETNVNSATDKGNVKPTTTPTTEKPIVVTKPTAKPVPTAAPPVVVRTPVPQPKPTRPPVVVRTTPKPVTKPTIQIEQ